MSEVATLDAIRAGGKPALARALTAIETMDGTAALAERLDEAAADPRADVIGLTGPPGVGKSTLTNALIQHYRAAGLSVGVVAIDPSSQHTGGALLGDRTRMKTDPQDQGVFVRSMAARDRLGGLSEHAIATIVLMRAVMDRVIVETVGVGQSESDIGLAVDIVVLCIQPGSGDSLQFMKAGIMELPDIFVVTKADMDKEARRARADLEGALTLARGKDGDPAASVILVSAVTGAGVDGLINAIDDRVTHRRRTGTLSTNRKSQARGWIVEAIRYRFGTYGLAAIAGEISGISEKTPHQSIRTLTERLNLRLT